MCMHPPARASVKLVKSILFISCLAREIRFWAAAGAAATVTAVATTAADYWTADYDSSGDDSSEQ